MKDVRVKEIKSKYDTRVVFGDYSLDDFNHDFDLRLEILRPLDNLELDTLIRDIHGPELDVVEDLELIIGDIA